MKLSDSKVLFLLPTTYYNGSGTAVQQVATYYKIPPESILVVHDELALPLGMIRTRHGGADAGNNGVKSISNHVGSDTVRLRIGVFNELRNRVNDAEFVLSKFSKDEQTILLKIEPVVHQTIQTFINGDFEATTHKHMV